MNHPDKIATKTGPRGNTSVSLSVEELRDIENVAYARHQSRAEFIRDAAVAAARKVLGTARSTRRPKVGAL